MTKPKAPAPKKQTQARGAATRRAHNPKKPGSTPGLATDTPKAALKRVADWERIETLYRAGTMSTREIATAQGVSHTAINKRAEKEGWTRDLSAKIKAKADALVSRAMVSTEVSAETKATETMVVEVESAVQARIRLAHRDDISKGRKLAMKLMAELEHQTDNRELYEQLVDVLAPIDDEQSERAKERAFKLRQAFERALSLSGRTKTMKDMADTLKTLIGLEREAFGLSNGDQGGGSDFERLVGDLPEAAI